MNVAECRRYMAEKGFPLVSYEGNMADDREFDLAETQGRIDTFTDYINIFDDDNFYGSSAYIYPACNHFYSTLSILVLGSQ